MTNRADETIVIYGADKVKAIQAISRLHFWRHTARMTAFGFRPRQGYTIKAFNDEYGHSARRWTEVAEAATELIRATRASWKELGE